MQAPLMRYARTSHSDVLTIETITLTIILASRRCGNGRGFGFFLNPDIGLCGTFGSAPTMAIASAGRSKSAAVGTGATILHGRTQIQDEIPRTMHSWE